ncbi:hypothetical protein [Neorhizobium galegae]|uniref:DUF1828 domain-containing protein n=1 Tax=Neorhizobium galegae bv. officinalis TaxID=323656 RepID=A0A0T7GJV9_NEOGA|nr:hypothetical protein [Neorhizobium galegae]CDZ47533.1 Hypothetical protein NGAL_HAMBI1189_19780 [Neorhizobium galegae bv. officinalis]
MINGLSVNQIAEEVARALSYSKVGNDGALIVTPLVYPGGGRVALRFQESSAGYFISDYGAGRREAELMGGRAIFTRIARSAAERYAVRFDSDMIFDIEVPREALVAASIAVANASKLAVDRTAEKLSEEHASDQRSKLWERLEAAFPGAYVAREAAFMGASSQWQFDAVLKNENGQSVFDIVSPHAASVNAAVAKFLDVKDLGQDAPARIAVALEKQNTPHLALLGRTAKIIDISSRIETFRAAA